MNYPDLHALYRGSASSRKFYLSQSVEMQIELGKFSQYIHTAEDLHRYTELIEKNLHSRRISDMLF